MVREEEDTRGREVNAVDLAMVLVEGEMLEAISVDDRDEDCFDARDQHLEEEEDDGEGCRSV